MWQWDPKEVINYNKRQLSLKQISNPKFKFRGKLAAQKKAGGFMQERLQDDGQFDAYEGGSNISDESFENYQVQVHEEVQLDEQ